MDKKKSAGKRLKVLPRFRVMCGMEIALGPGRVELLELIGETGSLRSAAKRMGVSYMRAWQLIGYTNRCFNKPVVEAVRGGKGGGGATLTDVGRKAVELYRGMEQASRDAVQRPWTTLKRLLRS
jgi:molybdate transport system regulatory protein